MDDKNQQVKDIGEAALIERLLQVLGTTGQGSGQGVLRGIGDDAAVLQNIHGTRLLAACDMLVEGVHFDLSYASPRQVGHKALAVNLSDIAAMGGRPRWALVTLGLKPQLEVHFVEEIYRGIAELAETYGVVIVGGDTCASPDRLLLDVCILGEANRKEITYRAGARDGDMILVTGTLGKSAAGLALLQNKEEIEGEGARELVEAHLAPQPRVNEANVLVRSGLVGAMNDISDGLATELWEVVSASGCAARIWAERLPISPAARATAAELGVDPLQWALYGGEDYELVLTIAGGKGAPLQARRLANSLKRATGTPLSFLGRIFASPESKVEMLETGEKMVELSPGGYDHFHRD